MNFKRIVLFVGALAALTGCSQKTVTIDKDVLMDKIMGGWAGQTIGCTYGGPTEFSYQGRMIPDSVEIKWPEHYIQWYYDNSPGLYDDVYMDLTFVDVFDRLGLDAPIDSFAVAFANAPYPLWHANQQARVNIFEGIMPPESGHWKNNPHADDIDFQIEADYAGLMAPAMPNAAAHYADGIGHIMNYGDGWYGGVYVAAMYSLAFVSSDINFVVEEALKIIPAESRYYKCMADVIAAHKADPSDWKAAWQMCEDRYSENFGCPGGIGTKFNIDAVINSAYILIGLLYGEGDFDKTLEISTRCGQDSDCNPASAGGILATMLGYSNIPEKWMANLHEVEDRDFCYTNISLNKVYQMSFDQACKVIELEGGKVGENSVTIPCKAIEAVRLEQSFEGLKINEDKVIDEHAYEQDVTTEFDGSGLLIKGRLRNFQKDSFYVGDVDIFIDGKLYKNVQLCEDNRARHEQIAQIFDLEEGHHTLTVKVNNPRKDKQVWVSGITSYTKK